MVTGQSFKSLVHHSVDGCLSARLVFGPGHRLFNALAHALAYGSLRRLQLWRRLWRRQFGLADLRLHFPDLFDDCPVDFLRKLQGVQQHGLGHEVGAGLDHHDGVAGTGNRQVELALFKVLVGWIDDQFPVQQADYACADGIVERYVRNGQRGGRADDADR